MILLLTLLTISYLAGSTPTSIIVVRVVKGIDIREHGSGNAGATNVFRVMGAKYAVFVTAVDIFKGWLGAAVVASWTFGGFLGELPFSDPVLIAILCGASAVLGHTYTIFAGFRGGKGVGTLAGMLIYLFPVAVAVGLSVWVVTLILSGYVGLSSVTAVSLFPLITYLQYGSLNSTIGYFSIIILLFIWYTHRSNISRLLAGTENRFEKARIFHRNK